MLQLRRGLIFVACVSAGFVISAGPGLVARAAEPDRWARAIVASASAAPQDAAQRRIAELEQRVKELEAERPAPHSGGKSSDLVTAGNAGAHGADEQLAARNLALSVKSQERVHHASELSDPAAAAPTDADPRSQLRYWAKQMRDGEPTFGRLSPEWNHAVNVLLRRERQLDPQNPWREP